MLLLQRLAQRSLSSASGQQVRMCIFTASRLTTAKSWFTNDLRQLELGQREQVAVRVLEPGDLRRSTRWGPGACFVLSRQSVVLELHALCCEGLHITRNVLDVPAQRGEWVRREGF